MSSTTNISSNEWNQSIWWQQSHFRRHYFLMNFVMSSLIMLFQFKSRHQIIGSMSVANENHHHQHGQSLLFINTKNQVVLYCPQKWIHSFPTRTSLSHPFFSQIPKMDKFLSRRHSLVMCGDTFSLLDSLCFRTKKALARHASWVTGFSLLWTLRFCSFHSFFFFSLEEMACFLACNFVSTFFPNVMYGHVNKFCLTSRNHPPPPWLKKEIFTFRLSGDFVNWLENKNFSYSCCIPRLTTAMLQPHSCAVGTCHVCRECVPSHHHKWC